MCAVLPWVTMASTKNTATSSNSNIIIISNNNKDLSNECKSLVVSLTVRFYIQARFKRATSLMFCDLSLSPTCLRFVHILIQLKVSQYAVITINFIAAHCTSPSNHSSQFKVNMTFENSAQNKKPPITSFDYVKIHLTNYFTAMMVAHND